MSDRSTNREGPGNSPAQRAVTSMLERVQAARRDQPNLAVSTDAVRVDDGHIVIQASATSGDGAMGSGIAATTVSSPDNWSAAIAFTEAEAVHRALDMLGIARPNPRQSRPSSSQPAQAAEEDGESAGPNRSPGAADRSRATSTRGRPAPQRERTPEPAPPAEEESTPEFVGAIRRANLRPAAPESGPPESPEPVDDYAMAEFQWSAFWKVARSAGLDARRVEQMLGHPANSGTPKEAVAALRDRGAWPDPPARA